MSTKRTQSLVGVLVILVDLFLLIVGRTHADWFFIALAGIGGFLISKEVVTDIIATAAKVLPWKQ